MPRALVKRFFYGDSIADFLARGNAEILDQLTEEQTQSFRSLDDTQRAAWKEEIKIMREFLPRFSGRGNVFFEYNIPRMGRRIDVVILLDGIVFLLEFKAFQEHFAKQDIAQVWDYALDLKNFHEASHERFIVPILVATGMENAFPRNDFSMNLDKIFVPVLASVPAGM